MIFESLVLWVFIEFDIVVLIELVCIDFGCFIISCYVGVWCELYVILFEFSFIDCV